MQTTMMISMRSTAKDLKRLRKARLECTFKQSQPNRLIKRGELVYISRRTHTKKICLPPGKIDELNAKFAKPPLAWLSFACPAPSSSLGIAMLAVVTGQLCKME